LIGGLSPSKSERDEIEDDETNEPSFPLDDSRVEQMTPTKNSRLMAPETQLTPLARLLMTPSAVSNSKFQF
jgi:hypothetical protein